MGKGGEWDPRTTVVRTAVVGRAWLRRRMRFRAGSWRLRAQARGFGRRCGARTSACEARVRAGSSVSKEAVFLALSGAAEVTMTPGARGMKTSKLSICDLPLSVSFFLCLRLAAKPGKILGRLRPRRCLARREQVYR